MHTTTRAHTHAHTHKHTHTRSGPGCSSLGGGFMSELGPFYPTQDGRALQANPYRCAALVGA
jgi:hypothetical protein